MTFTIRDSGTIISNIETNLADNNAGNISAADVRVSMGDLAQSVNLIVASGDTDSQYPFYNDVRAKLTAGNGGTFIAESGIKFPNGANTNTQTEPYLGPEGINHNDLANLTAGDPHSQYLPVDGSREMTGNLDLNSNWINQDGQSDKGLKFSTDPSGVTEITTSGYFKFDDASTITDGNGVARAWLDWDASTASPTVNSYYNIHSLTKVDTGKYIVAFESGIFRDQNYFVVGTSNGRSTAANMEDFAQHTVGTALKSTSGNYETVTFAVLDDSNTYVDAKVNSIVAFGLSTEATSGTHPLVVS